MEKILKRNTEVRKSDNFAQRTMRISPFDIQGKIWAVILVVLAMLFVIFASAYNWSIPLNIDPISFPGQHVGKPKDVYGIIFDAGSTGSRIHIFHFLSYGPSKKMALVKDTFREVKPGLSAYAENIDKAAKSLIGMLDEAKLIVPPDLRHSCPIALKATAGLRLLGPETAEFILNKVHELFKTYPFLMVDNSIEIMSGIDEGVFSWITVNYLLDLLLNNQPTVVALDLGGGSTQLTFVPFSPQTLAQAPENFKKNISLFGINYKLYTHSYLGLGLMSARFQMMDNIPGDPPKLTTPCFIPGITETLSKGGIKYIVSARPDHNGFDPCYSIAQGLIKRNVQLVPELKDHHIIAFSYFYDRGVESGMIDPAGGNVTVGNFLEAARNVCSNHLKDQPYLCMDLTYIYSILHDGYTLPLEKNIQLAKKVKGFEVSWALGAMFDLFAKATFYGHTNKR